MRPGDEINFGAGADNRHPNEWRRIASVVAYPNGGETAGNEHDGFVTLAETVTFVDGGAVRFYINDDGIYCDEKGRTYDFSVRSFG